MQDLDLLAFFMSFFFIPISWESIKVGEDVAYVPDFRKYRTLTGRKIKSRELQLHDKNSGKAEGRSKVLKREEKN